jgi:hypothetical protein
MLPVALAITDEYAQESDNLLEETGRLEKLINRFHIFFLCYRIFQRNNEYR